METFTRPTANPKPVTRQQFEYKVITAKQGSLAHTLNHFAREGWYVMAMSPHKTFLGATTHVSFTLERELR